jgi:hypothetical protein
MKRDQKGRFTKEDYSNDSYEFKLSIPSLKNFIFIIMLIIIFLPWSVIISRIKIFEKIFHFFEDIMTEIKEEEPQKKNGIFY